jgi:glycerol-3-phosphate acyltransferase PlsY
VATSLGVLLVVDPAVACAAVILWLAVVVGTRRSSLGALLTLPAVVGLTAWWSSTYVEWSAVLAGIVLVRHAENISRLLAERELGLHDSEATDHTQTTEQDTAEG